MDTSAWMLLVAFLVALGALAWPLGGWLAAVAEGGVHAEQTGHAHDGGDHSFLML